MRARNGLASAGQIMKRKANKGERQRGKNEIQQGLIDMAEGRRLDRQDAFAETLMTMAVPPLAEDDDPLPSACQSTQRWPDMGGLTFGS